MVEASAPVWTGMTDSQGRFLPPGLLEEPASIPRRSDEALRLECAA